MLDIYEFLDGKEYTLVLSNGSSITGVFKFWGNWIKHPRREYKYHLTFYAIDGAFFDMTDSERVVDIAIELGYQE